jgi:methylaspartate ammonia-lyase
MSTCTVTVTREDNLWVADAAGLPDHVVNVIDYQSLADLHADVPGWLADLLGVDEVAAVEYRYAVNGHDVTAQMRHLLEAQHELRRAQAEQERTRKEALAALADAGVSQRVMADVLGVSHQRVHQLVRS